MYQGFIVSPPLETRTQGRLAIFEEDTWSVSLSELMTSAT
jgi:hypothetical protein